ncbi:MAG: U32 family peptidase [Lachnospiraceae bacterium]|nr:U32 family peptidase [Lachnospiraceae bacterium]
MNKKPEILAPAGSMESLRAAIAAGCDAVYMGGSRFGARAYADNPDEDGLIQAIRYCHLHGVKLYMTVNTLLKQSELDELPQYIEPYYLAGVDAVIVQDMGVLHCLHKHFPDLELHASTQMTLTMGMGVDERLAPYGVTRIVPAREMSLEELSRMRQETELELEVFVHGALCYCYSGQCLMSSMQGGRSGNRGRCAQPCRLPYEIDGKKQYLLSTKELCALPRLGELIRTGVDSFKIEGRMKRPEYTAFVTAIYRKYRDMYLAMGEGSYENWKREHQDEWQENLRKLAEIYNREGFTDGYLSSDVNGMLSARRPKHGGVFVGSVKSVKGQQAEIALEKAIAPQDVLEFRHEAGEALYEYTVGESCVAGGCVRARFQKGSGIRPGDKVYRTRHQVLLEEIGKKYIQESEKLHITGVFTAKEGVPCRLLCRLRDEEVMSEGTVTQAAEKHPALSEDVKRVLMQTGDTEFVFDKLQVELQGDLFLPVGELKRLRREALHLLTVKWETREERVHIPEAESGLKAEGRGGRTGIKSESAHSNFGEESEYPSSETCVVSVAVMNAGQLKAVLNQEQVAEIILRDEEFAWEELEQGIMDIKQSGKRAVLALPSVFRLRTYERYEKCFREGLKIYPDGYLIRNQESFSFLRDIGNVPPEKIRLDANLYIMNESALRWWKEQGVTDYTAPWELTGKELFTLSVGHHMQWICYGRIPLMLSAQCVKKNTSECGKGKESPGICCFRGEKGRRFLAVNYCKNCYSMIYKEEPFLIPKEDYGDRVAVRYEFTTETPDEVLSVLRGEKTRKTERGHFDKGIL